jgi:hypothetical protein
MSKKTVIDVLRSAASSLCVAGGLSLLGSMAEAVSDLDTKIAAVLPNSQEDAWLQIGWHTNLMQARALAQNEQRPLFLWVMNGHPLGCT